MVSTIVDAACVLADRAIENSLPDNALWAVGQGLLASPDNDALAVRRIHALALAGRSAEADRAVLELTRALRADSRDLAPFDAVRIQDAMRLVAPKRSSLSEGGG